MQSGRLAATVKTWDGRLIRWGPGEADPRRIPQDLSFDTSVPGAGYGLLDIHLFGEIDEIRTDVEGFNEIWVYLPGVEPVFEGYITAAPRSGDGFDVQAVGWSAVMKDNPILAMPYIDRDLGHWQEPSRYRRVALEATGWQLEAVSYSQASDASAGLPALTMTAEGPFTNPNGAWLYDAGPAAKVARMLGTISPLTGLASHGLDANNNFNAYTDSDDSVASVTGIPGGDVSGGGTFDLQPTTAERVLLLNWWYTSVGAGNTGQSYGYRMTNPVVIADHGLPIRGPFPNQGIYASDALPDIIARAAAPLITLPGDIDPSTFAIPHLVCGLEEGGIDADAGVAQVDRFHLNDHGVYNGKRWFWHAPGTWGPTWIVRRDEGAEPVDHGDDVQDIFESVIVSYEDPAGDTRRVGPPGSGADTEDPALRVNDLKHLAVKHGRIKRERLDANGKLLQAGAIQLGSLFLTEAARRNRSGTMDVAGEVRMLGAGEARFPCSLMKGGHGVIVENEDGSRADPRRIVSTDYDDGAYANALDLDSPPGRLGPLLEALQVSLTGRV